MVPVDRSRPTTCERCLQFEEELRDLRQRLAASGQYVTYSPGPNPNVDEELRRWLATSPRVDAAGSRAGWARLARFVSPRVRDWEARFERARRAHAGLRWHIAVLVAKVQRLERT